MKHKTIQSLFSAGLLLATAFAAAAQGTAAFTYQGKLTDRGSDANGVYDFQFNLYDVGAATYRSTIATNDVGVSNGVFSVTLDFGPTWFDGRQLSMLVQVRPGNSTGAYTNLLPLVPILSAPYATYAAKAGSVAGNSITAPSIASGQVVKSLNGLKDNVNLVAGANVTLSPNANNLTISANVGAFSLNGASAYYSGGNVGIGTLSPVSKLHVEGDTYLSGKLIPAGESMTIQNAANGGRLGLGSVGSSSTVYLVGVNAAGTESADHMLVAGLGLNNLPRLTLMADNTIINGNVGIGTSAPWDKLHVYGGNLLVEGYGGEKAYLGGDGWGSDMQIGSYNPAIETISAYNQASHQWMNLVVKSLTIMGGADLAEPFEMSHQDIPPGAVVVIDEANPGQLKMSDRAYDSRVAGVVSGANGIRAGISLQQEGKLDAGRNVALTGRVYVQADASEHPIKPGDLLTTSDVPGHAMKAAAAAKAPGATLGKAMTALEGGRGLVLVLVSLQ